MSFFVIKNEAAAVFFQYVGLAVVSLTLFRTLQRIFNNLGTFYLGFGSVNFKKFGSWAVVTGCTDGIGKAYAEAFVKKGLNVVLISRTLQKLEEQSKELKEKYSVQTKVIAADFTEPNSIYEDIKRQLTDLDIAVLVNNVGVGHKHPDFFDAFGQSNKDVNDMINCNITSVTKMTAIVLPGMVKKSGGVIINNASASGRIPTPLLTVYSATKAYVDYFSRGLNIEYSSKGIYVQSLCPYFVSTKLSAVRSSLTAPKPHQYVSSALRTVGSQSVTNGCLIHNIQGYLFENVIPRNLFNSLMFSQLLATRKRAIEKLKRSEAAQKKE